MLVSFPFSASEVFVKVPRSMHFLCFRIDEFHFLVVIMGIQISLKEIRSRYFFVTLIITDQADSDMNIFNTMKTTMIHVNTVPNAIGSFSIRLDKKG